MAKNSANQSKKKEEKKEVLTKEDFLKALKKASRPLKPKASRGKGKKKTSE
jgi:hypothetical protein